MAAHSEFDGEAYHIGEEAGGNCRRGPWRGEMRWPRNACIFTRPGPPFYALRIRKGTCRSAFELHAIHSFAQFKNVVGCDILVSRMC